MQESFGLVGFLSRVEARVDGAIELEHRAPTGAPITVAGIAAGKVT